MWTAALTTLATLGLAGTAGLWLRARSRGRRLQAELADARERLEAAREAQEAFFDLVTHELRAPLAAILGYQELLQDGAYGRLDPGVDEPVERIGRSARHLLHLIDGVVELSRLRTGGLRPTPGSVNLGVLLTAIADVFRTQVRDRSLKAEVHMPDSLPTLRSDQDRLVRALHLLVMSAVKHPAGDTLTLDIETGPDGLHLQLHETEIAVRTDVDDPALRLGLRLAVADGLARLLGGRLELSPPDDPVARRISFHVPDLRPDADATPVTL